MSYEFPERFPTRNHADRYVRVAFNESGLFIKAQSNHKTGIDPRVYVDAHSPIPKAFAMEPVGPQLPALMVNQWMDRTEWEAVKRTVCDRVKAVGGVVYVRVDREDEI